MRTVGVPGSVDDALAEVQVDTLFSTTLATAGMNMFGAIAAATILVGDARPIGLAFIGVTAVLLLARIILLILYKRRTVSRTTWWVRAAFVFLVASGITWGSLLYWAAHRGSDPQILVVTTIGLGAAMMTVMNIAVWQAVSSFQIPFMTVAAVGFLFSGRPGHLQIGLASAMLGIAMFIAARKLGERIVRSMRLAIENDRLANQLRDYAGALEHANRELEALSRIDGLTGLANRRWFDATIEREWARAVRMETSLALVTIDIDNFKSFNDQYGHAAGDECLKAVSRAIESHVRSDMDLAARPGGEEFALLLPVTVLEDAVRVAERVRLAVIATTEDSAFSLPCSVTVSVGVAAGKPSDGRNLAALREDADRALYQAKALGRNRVNAEPALAIAGDSPRASVRSDIPRR